SHHTNDLINFPERTKVIVCGLLKSSSVRTTKSGFKLASGIIEDLTGQVSFVCFQKTLERIGEDIFHTDKPVMITGSLKIEGESDGEEDSRKAEIMVDSVELLSDVRARRVTHIQFRIDESHKPEDIEKLRSLLSEPANQGNTLTYLKFESGSVDAQMRLPHGVCLTDEFLHNVDACLGLENYQLK
ncbi:MAG: hypothetical protein IJM59_12195, partial [Proteobacteria bacterium]|nr:hypothetical protein [Pseudomonadota bacterium]